MVLQFLTSGLLETRPFTRPTKPSIQDQRDVLQGPRLPEKDPFPKLQRGHFRAIGEPDQLAENVEQPNRVRAAAPSGHVSHRQRATAEVFVMVEYTLIR
jgi:hypothetical protein